MTLLFTYQNGEIPRSYHKNEMLLANTDLGDSTGVLQILARYAVGLHVDKSAGSFDKVQPQSSAS